MSFADDLFVDLDDRTLDRPEDTSLQQLRRRSRMLRWIVGTIITLVVLLDVFVGSHCVGRAWAERHAVDVQAAPAPLAPPPVAATPSSAPAPKRAETTELSAKPSPPRSPTPARSHRKRG